MENIDFVEPLKKYKHIKIIIVIGFISIFGLIIMTAFFDFTLTGNVIDDITPKKNSTIDVRADLTVPNLELEGDFEKITIRGGSSSNLYVGDSKYYLGDSNSNFIILEGFDGDISFDSSGISLLDGRAAKVSFNGVSSTPKDDGNTWKVEIDEDIRYDFLEVRGGVSIDKLSYTTSGTIRINNEKNIFQVNNEEVSMKDFQGDLTVNSKSLGIDGKINGLEIKGEQGISIKS